MKKGKLLLVLFCLFIVNTHPTLAQDSNAYVDFRVKTYELQREYLEGITKHQAEVMRDMEYKLKQQRWQTNVIAVMVFLMVLAGLYLSFLQFKQDAIQGEKSSFTFKVGSGSFEIGSNVIGLAILVMSFWFFQTYIDRVYSVEVFTMSPLDVTTFGVNR